MSARSSSSLASKGYNTFLYADSIPQMCIYIIKIGIWISNKHLIPQTV